MVHTLKLLNVTEVFENISCLIDISIEYCYPRDVLSTVYATAKWLGGWVSVTRRYCIKMAKSILKLF